MFGNTLINLHCRNEKHHLSIFFNKGLNLKGLKTQLTSKKETKVTNHSRNGPLRSSTKQGEYHLVGGTGQTEPPPSQEGLMSANKLKGKKIRAKNMGKPKNQELTNF